MSYEHSDHDRNRRRYGKADDELTGFFSNAIGVKAQNINDDPKGGDQNEWHYSRLRAMQRGHMAWFDSVARTVVLLPVDHRKTVMAVYTPHAAPTWLQDALSPPWGGGSFVRLAAGLPRAVLAAAERQEGRTVLDWLSARGRRAKDDLLTSLREDAEALRMPALAAYEALRKERIKSELAADSDRAKAKAERNMRLYSELVGRRARRDSERFARKTRRAA